MTKEQESQARERLMIATSNWCRELTEERAMTAMDEYCQIREQRILEEFILQIEKEKQVFPKSGFDDLTTKNSGLDDSIEILKQIINPKAK
jgi:hypothetical protein